MREVTGDYEIHLTSEPEHAGPLAAFAGRHGLKFVHIELDRGWHRSQPMVTVTGHGSWADQQAAVRRWEAGLRAAGIEPRRAKVEVTPWSDGVPEADPDAWDEPGDRYFEHHVKLVLRRPAETELEALVDLVAPYGAHLSRNARRTHPDGAEERFVTQRCFGFGSATAGRRLDALTAALRAAGHEIAEVEREYVVYDSNLHHDLGWLSDPSIPGWRPAAELRLRSSPAGRPGFPPTYQPVSGPVAVRQSAAFDPAVKHFGNAFRAGEPEFLVAATGERWRAARRAAMDHVLTVVAESRWAGHLVLRGSVTMAAWAGAAAREPGDLDFVVTPPTVTSGSAEAAGLLAGLRAALGGAGPITETAIWTYERADGRRLAVPFRSPDGTGGHVQVDIVFGEELPLPPEMLALPGLRRPVLAAPAPLALAWKLLWLATDMWPQGKDLYDAVLLAEHTTVAAPLVRELMRPELGRDADGFTAETVLGWDVDWPNFTDEYPWVTGTAEDWLLRLATALGRAWS